jgi:hypothetical protein
MNKLDCYMALEITTDKVQHMARELFGIRLETVAGLRYVYLPGSASKILPNPMFTLQGCGCNNQEEIVYIIPSNYDSMPSQLSFTFPSFPPNQSFVPFGTMPSPSHLSYDAVGVLVSVAEYTRKKQAVQ